ncbi:hypothetical protein NDU88_001574 [Pleurodeles waltl]|uniref:Uncharacterized protein n=1 Tax=Pleurodeles waltl TaxID=8319 RepID=A0AAV7LYC0_PLEWA|nr:hypothetical protein NDU88_001574 [Pleurodeles waltl]
MTYDAEGVINIRREDGRERSGEKKEEPRTRGSRSEEIAIGASEEEKETTVTEEPTTERETAITRGPEEEKDTRCESSPSDRDTSQTEATSSDGPRELLATPGRRLNRGTPEAPFHVALLRWETHEPRSQRAAEIGTLTFQPRHRQVGREDERRSVGAARDARRAFDSRGAPPSCMIALGLIRMRPPVEKRGIWSRDRKE